MTIVSDRQVIMESMERQAQTRYFLGGGATPGSCYGATFMVPLKTLFSLGPTVPLLQNSGSASAKGIQKFSALAT